MDKQQIEDQYRRVKAAIWSIEDAVCHIGAIIQANEAMLGMPCPQIKAWRPEMGHVRA